MSYGLIKGLFGAAILRTYSAMGMLRDNTGDRPLFGVCALATASYFLLLLVEGVEKRRLYQLEYSVRLGCVHTLACEAEIELILVILKRVCVVVYHSLFVPVVVAFTLERKKNKFWARRPW